MEMTDVAAKLEAALIDSESMYLDEAMEIIRMHTRYGDHKVVCRIQNISLAGFRKKMKAGRVVCTDPMVRRAIEGFISLWRNPEIEFEYLNSKNIV